MSYATEIYQEASIPIHHDQDFESMRQAGRLAALALDMISPFVKAGVQTAHLDKLIHQFTLDNGALPATLNYRGFRHSCCISVNHVVCHGIPSDKRLKDGDIVNIDVTLIKDGWHGDTSRMFWIGKISPKARLVIKTAFDAMWAGIKTAKPGAHIGDIGVAIEKTARAANMSVVREFTGHGLGRIFHTTPTIFNFGIEGGGAELKEGMFFTIEPMVNIGKAATKILADGWTAVTRDRSLSAQFEHSVGITKTGCEVFTQSQNPDYDPLAML